MKTILPALLLLAAALAAGCTNQIHRRGGYLVPRGFAPYENDNPIARATALAAAPDQLAGVTWNKADRPYFFFADLSALELTLEKAATGAEAEARLAAFVASQPGAWQTVAPQSATALAAMRTLRLDTPRGAYSAGTSSRLGDDAAPVRRAGPSHPHQLPDGAAAGAAGN